MIPIEPTSPACDDNVVKLRDRYERPIRIRKGAPIMPVRLSRTIPSLTLFNYLTDDNLESVESSEEKSIYKYGCGCIAVRGLPSSDCYVEWCSTHAPELGRKTVLLRRIQQL